MEEERRAAAAATAAATEKEEEDKERKEEEGPCHRPAEPRVVRLFVLAGSQPTRFRVVSRSDAYLVTGPTPA